MQMVYLGAAVLGGALLLIQLVISLVGGGVDVDAPDTDVHLDASDGFSSLSFRTVVAFITFFGLAGLGTSAAGAGPTVTFLCALVAGGVAFWLVGLAMFQLSRLRASGTVEIANAVGARGRVYLLIPAAKAGTGAVTVPVQGRTMQYRAVTAGSELATGALCKVTAVVANDTVEVEAST